MIVLLLAACGGPSTRVPAPAPAPAPVYSYGPAYYSYGYVPAPTYSYRYGYRSVYDPENGYDPDGRIGGSFKMNTSGDD